MCEMEESVKTCVGFCQTPVLVLRRGVDFVLPLSQEEEEEKEQPPPKSNRWSLTLKTKSCFC